MLNPSDESPKKMYRPKKESLNNGNSNLFGKKASDISPKGLDKSDFVQENNLQMPFSNNESLKGMQDSNNGSVKTETRDVNSARRSTRRLSTNSMGARKKKIRLDHKAVISLVFEILVQNSHELEMKDFKLPLKFLNGRKRESWLKSKRKLNNDHLKLKKEFEIKDLHQKENGDIMYTDEEEKEVLPETEMDQPEDYQIPESPSVTSLQKENHLSEAKLLSNKTDVCYLNISDGGSPARKKIMEVTEDQAISANQSPSNKKFMKVTKSCSNEDQANSANGEIDMILENDNVCPSQQIRMAGQSFQQLINLAVDLEPKNFTLPESLLEKGDKCSIFLDQKSISEGIEKGFYSATSINDNQLNVSSGRNLDILDFPIDVQEETLPSPGKDKSTLKGDGSSPGNADTHKTPLNSGQEIFQENPKTSDFNMTSSPRNTGAEDSLIDMPNSSCLSCFADEPVIRLHYSPNQSLLVCQQISHVHIWKQVDQSDWVTIYSHKLPSDEIIIDSCQLSDAIVLLVSGETLKLLLLAIARGVEKKEYSVQLNPNKIFISAQLCSLYNGFFGSNINFSEEKSSVKAHKICQSKKVSMKSIRLEESGHCLSNLIPVQNLTNGILGCGPRQFFIWNYLSGKLVKVIPLLSSSNLMHFTNHWTSVESGLLFCLIQSSSTRKFHLIALNSLGRYDMLKTYAKVLSEHKSILKRESSCSVNGSLVTLLDRNSGLTVYNILTGMELANLRSQSLSSAITVKEAGGRVAIIAGFKNGKVHCYLTSP